MKSAERKRELTDATMQIVAEQGLHGFSMRQVTRKVGVSEALLYRYFPTKEELLYSCFESMHKGIAAVFAHAKVPDFENLTDTFETIRNLWTDYFVFLVKSGYRTIFYFDYRDSSYMKHILEKDEEARNTYFSGFVQLFYAFENKYHILKNVESNYLWTYILDTTGIFAKRVIRGELPASDENYDVIFKLIFGGIYGLFV